MQKRIISLMLVLILSLTLLLPQLTVSAADRIEYAIPQATKYIGTRDQNMNVYGSFMVASRGGGASFSVFVPEAGKYDISVRVSSTVPVSVNAKLNGTSVANAEFNSEGYANYVELQLCTLEMHAGYSTLDITATDGGMMYFSHVYLSKAVAGKVEMDFLKNSGAFKNHWVPTILEAEDFDFGSAVSMTTATAINQSYRKDSPLSVKADSSATVVAMSYGDSMAYTFEVPKTGVYALSALASSGGDIRLYFDGNPGYVKASLESLAETSVGAIYLTKGTHYVKAECVSDSLNLDKLRFKTAKQGTDYFKPSELTAGNCIIIASEEEVEKEPNPVWKELWVSPEGSDKGTGTQKAPFATLTAAKEAAKKLAPNMKGDIVINILPGTYPVTEKIEFTTEDSGKNGYNIVYRGTDSDDKPILSGGRTITGWQKVDDKIWSAKVDEDIDMVRQLYINEYPARIARSKYEYNGDRAYDDPMTEAKEDGFYVSKKNFPELSNSDDAEILFHFMWCLHYFPLAGIDDAGDEWLIRYDQPYFGRYLQGAASHSTPSAGIAVWIANAPELIDEPGEFYFDRKTKTVYYYAFPEEDMTTAEVYTPQTEGLMTVTGVSKTDKVENIVFDNLDFRHGAWNDIARTGMFVGQGDSIINGDEPNPQSKESWQNHRIPDQIEINFADNISITNCSFVNLGSTALALRNCVTNSRVDGNIFRDLAGSGVVIGDIKYTNGVHTVEDLSRYISVKNNVIRRIGHDYNGCIGIVIFYANSVDVMYNDIRYVPCVGISIGWGWGAAISDIVRSGEHMIANNRIDYSSQGVYDGGAIYTLSSMKGMYIQGNYMSNSPDSGGLYFDQGSANIVARDNVLEDNEKNSLYAGVNISDVYRNYTNYVDSGSNSPWYNGDGIVTQRPIRTEGDNWPPEARAIMANAGLQDNYKKLLDADKVPYPEWRTMPVRVLVHEKFVSDTEVVRFASDWIPGGEGVAFHELNDKEPEDYGKKGSFVGNTLEGEWIKYSIPVKTSGHYDISLYYSLAFDTGDNAAAVSVYVDGVKVGDAIDVKGTGSWNSYQAVSIANVMLTEGEHEVKLEFAKNACAVSRFEFINSDFKGSDIDYDDGIMFKLPQ